MFKKRNKTLLPALIAGIIVIGAAYLLSVNGGEKEGPPQISLANFGAYQARLSECNFPGHSYEEEPGVAAALADLPSIPLEEAGHIYHSATDKTISEIIALISPVQSNKVAILHYNTPESKFYSYPKMPGADPDDMGEIETPYAYTVPANEAVLILSCDDSTIAEFSSEKSEAYGVPQVLSDDDVTGWVMTSALSDDLEYLTANPDRIASVWQQKSTRSRFEYDKIEGTELNDNDFKIIWIKLKEAPLATVAPVCGDGVCSDSELLSCSEDCGAIGGVPEEPTDLGEDPARTTFTPMPIYFMAPDSTLMLQYAIASGLMEPLNVLNPVIIEALEFENILLKEYVQSPGRTYPSITVSWIGPDLDSEYADYTMSYFKEGGGAEGFREIPDRNGARALAAAERVPEDITTSLPPYIYSIDNDAKEIVIRNLPSLRDEDTIYKIKIARDGSDYTFTESITLRDPRPIVPIELVWEGTFNTFTYNHGRDNIDTYSIPILKGYFQFEPEGDYSDMTAENFRVTKKVRLESGEYGPEEDMGHPSSFLTRGWELFSESVASQDRREFYGLTIKNHNYYINGEFVRLEDDKIVGRLYIVNMPIDQKYIFKVYIINNDGWEISKSFPSFFIDTYSSSVPFGVSSTT